ncbi:hypothetical protein C8R45DRAFT_305060 [Mycena sanguinolenta]|nr:hypothetical protein C8R45DRAFT_305060 [Mycena sanguinolenta]
MPPTDTQQNCFVCGTLTAKKCSRCRIKFYCSDEHQKSDWKKHKAVCLSPAVTLPAVVKTRVEAELDGDGTKFTIDAILLPWDSDTPRLVKIICEIYTDPYDEDLGKQHRIDFSPYSERNDFSESATISTMGYTGPPLGYTLFLVWNGNFLQDGSPLNRSIVKLTKGKADHPWAGNLVACRVEEPITLVARYQDAKAEDLTALAAYFVDYGKRARELYG